jgi:hypothetical protein
VRALSGYAVEKFPQNDPNVQATAFSYRMTVETVPYVPFDFNATNYLPPWPPNLPAATLNELRAISNNWRIANNLLANSAELRLYFRWPLLAGGIPGDGRQSYRTLLGGQLLATNDPGWPQPLLYFFQSQSYTNVNVP